MTADTPIEHDIMPIPINLNRLPGRKSNATKDMIFIAEVAGLGVTNYYAKASQTPTQANYVSTSPSTNNDFVILDNGVRITRYLKYSKFNYEHRNIHHYIESVYMFLCLIIDNQVNI